MVFDYQNVLIYGYSKSGQAVEQVLIHNKIKHKIYDDNLKLYQSRPDDYCSSAERKPDDA